MNYQFDLIVIGDSKKGNEAVKYIAAAKAGIKIAFVSREFKSTTTHDFLNVEYINDEVILVDYKNRLFGCYLKNGNRLYSTHLIVASGLEYAPLLLNNKQVPSVFNTTDDVSKTAKNLQAIVLGCTDADVKLAQSVAKKYKYVYFCIDSLNTHITKSNMDKLADIKNLVVLLNASITKVLSIDNQLKEVELDNYSKITCSAIYVKTPSKPEVAFIPDKIIAKDAEGYLDTTANLESNLVPKCFATGNCTKKNTKKMNLAMYESILNDF